MDKPQGLIGAGIVFRDLGIETEAIDRTRMIRRQS
jgi:hypothetical protein